MQKVAFTDELLNGMKHMTSYLHFDDDSVDAVNKDTTGIPTAIQYPVETVVFDEDLADCILDRELPDSSTHSAPKYKTMANFFTIPSNPKTVCQKLRAFFAQQHVSDDKLLPLNIMFEHFTDVLSGMTERKTPPFLLIVGAPGTGKSWLVKIIVEMAEAMDLDTPIWSAWMGIASINIGRSTLCSLWDIPCDLQGQASNGIKPWNVDRLEALKKSI